jgi:hypothetical protein
VVRIRANTTSTHEKIKQKKHATPMPGAIATIRNFTKKLIRECPSRKAVSSKAHDAAGEDVVKEVSMLKAQSWAHINMLGEYDFSEEKLRDTLGIIPPKKAA